MSDPLPIGEIFSSIQGEGYLAGRRQIFIRLTACNLECRYCDTPFSADEPCAVEREPGSTSFDLLPQPLPLERVGEIIQAWTGALPGAHHSISLTGGEPLLFAQPLAAWLPRLRAILPLHLETNGTLFAEMEQLRDQFDYVSMDMKLPSTAGCGDELWEAHRRFLAAAGSSQVSVKVVVADGTPVAEMERVCDIIAALRPQTPLFIQPLTTSHSASGIAAVHLLRLQALAAARLTDVRVIPQMHKLMGVP